jgi:hypothetical protein
MPRSALGRGRKGNDSSPPEMNVLLIVMLWLPHPAARWVTERHIVTGQFLTLTECLEVSDHFLASGLEKIQTRCLVRPTEYDIRGVIGL